MITLHNVIYYITFVSKNQMFIKKIIKKLIFFQCFFVDYLE